MLDVIKAFAQAGLVQRDIKPENVLINKHTGEVIVIDAGVSTEIASPLMAGTLEFMPDDHTKEDRGADAASDVYSAGATMATIAEGLRRVISIKTNSEFVAPHAKDGAQRGLVGRLDAHGKFYTRPANQIDSAHSTFTTQCLSRKDGKRLMPDQALKDQFLRDSMLDDDAARAVLQKALNIADTENAKDKNDQWLTVKPARSAPDAQGRSSYPLDPEERARLRQGINSIATYAQYLDSCGDDQALLSELSAFASDTEFIRRLNTDVQQCVRRLLEMGSSFSIVPKGELLPFTRPGMGSTGKPEDGVSASTEKRQRPINASHSVDLNGVQRRPRAEGQVMNPVKIRPRGLIELARTLGIVTTGTSEENSQRLFAELKRYMNEASAFIRQIDGLPDSVKPNKFTLDEIQRRADNAARIIDKIHRQTLVYNKHKDVGKLSGSPELGELQQKLGRLYQSRINLVSIKKRLPRQERSLKFQHADEAHWQCSLQAANDAFGLGYLRARYTKP